LLHLARQFQLALQTLLLDQLYLSRLELANLGAQLIDQSSTLNRQRGLIGKCLDQSNFTGLNLYLTVECTTIKPTS